MKQSERLYPISFVRCCKQRRLEPRLVRWDHFMQALLTPPRFAGGWDGPAFLAGAPEPGKPRKKENMERMSLLVYDVDGPKCFDKRRQQFLPGVLSKKPTRGELAEWIASQQEDPIDFLIQRAPFPGVAYTTWSHGWAKAWAWRLILQLPCVMGQQEWQLLWRWGYDWLGHSAFGLDRKCSDASRIHFLPRRPKDAQDHGLAPRFETRRVLANREAHAQLIELIGKGKGPLVR